MTRSSAPPPPTIAPLVEPSLDDLARLPKGMPAAPKPRKPPRRITWLAMGLVAGLTAGIVAHDWMCTTFPRTHGWVLQTGQAIHDVFSPPAPGAVVAVGVPSAAVPRAASASATASAATSRPPAPASASVGAAPSAAASGPPATMRIDELPKAKR